MGWHPGNAPPNAFRRFGRIGSHEIAPFFTPQKLRKAVAVYLHGLRILRSWSSKVFVGVAKEKTKRTNHNTWTCFFR